MVLTAPEEATCIVEEPVCPAPDKSKVTDVDAEANPLIWLKIISTEEPDGTVEVA